MHITKKLRLLEKLAQQPMMQEPAPEQMAAEGQAAAGAMPAEAMPGGDPEGAVEKLEMLMETLNSAGQDAAKFDSGNSAAGTRLRKKALEAAKQLKSLRAEVQEVKGSRKAEKAQAMMMQMAQEQAAAQQQAEMEQEQNKAPADKLFDPGAQQQAQMQAQQQPPQMQPKMAAADKEKQARMFRGLRNYFAGGGGRPGLFNKKLSDLTLGEKILGLGGGAAALTAGIRGTDAAIDAVAEPRKKRKAMAEMMAENPSLAKENPKDVSKIFNTLYRFNPRMAEDPLVSGSFMRRSLQYRDEGIQPQDVKTLAEIGKLTADTRKKETLLQAMLGAGLA